MGAQDGVRRTRRWQARAQPASNSDCTPSAEVEPAEPGPDNLLPLSIADASMQELLPGFVHMKGVLPLAMQQKLMDMSCLITAESRASGCSGGWYRWQGGNNWNLNDGTKARFWDDVKRFPPDFPGLGHQLASLAAKKFERHLEAPTATFQPRVGALNFYTARGRMGWHVDDTNFAKANVPIVMANLGDSADFGYKLNKGDTDKVVRLDSGDVIVFGGPSRNLVHALLQVHQGTTPPELLWPEMPGRGRISVTWRDAGPEDGLTFNSDERLGLRVTENTLPRYKRAR